MYTKIIGLAFAFLVGVAAVDWFLIFVGIAVLAMIASNILFFFWRGSFGVAAAALVAFGATIGDTLFAFAASAFGAATFALVAFAATAVVVNEAAFGAPAFVLNEAVLTITVAEKRTYYYRIASGAFYAFAVLSVVVFYS